MLIDDCVAYFKGNKGFKRAFEAMRKKYLSLGTLGGTVVIQKLTADEKSALSGLLRKDFSKKNSVSIKMIEFQRALDRTRFGTSAFEDVLKLYFEDALVSNSQQQLAYLDKRENFFSSLIKKFDQTPGGIWLEKTIQAKKSGYNTIIQRYDSDLQGLDLDLNYVCTALNNLPIFKGNRMRLPVFASKITFNPHAFDEGTGCGQLLIFALASYFCVTKPETRLERSELLYMAGILIDDVSNKVLCSGLKAFDKYGLHIGWEGFLVSNEAFLATLTNLSSLTKIESPYKVVFVVENPSVFVSIRDDYSNLSGWTNGKKHCETCKAEIINVPMICGYGQINMSTLALMDLLTENEVTIYYSGDYDPEGLLIADKLKNRYGNKLILWRYSIDDYKKCISQNVASLPRLKQLSNISSVELKQIAEAIAANGLCGYQEQLIDDLSYDIRNVLNTKILNDF
ncbi:MAG: TIGR02679 family protein [Ruminiclostridium sp.]